MLAAAATSSRADPPGLAYLFPAGGQRNTTVTVRAGGLCLHDRCSFAFIGPGVHTDGKLTKIDTIFFEGSILPLPDSQRQENYPQDMAAKVRIAADAPLGKRNALAWTAEGGCSGPVFVVGDLPEVVEGENAAVHRVTLPVTANGRIFPREDTDEWSFDLSAGTTLSAEAVAEKIGTPLRVRLEAFDAAGNCLAESGGWAGAADARLRFTATAEGTYRIRVSDTRVQGGPDYVYRLTMTAGPFIDSVFPLGGRRGTTTAFDLRGARLPRNDVNLTLPNDQRDTLAQPFVASASAALPHRIELDDLPELIEKEPNNTPDARPGAAVPFVANGRIGAPGDVDCWPVQLVKGKAYEFDLRAHRLDSPLLPVLTLRDGKGKELARADALEQNVVDPKITFTAPADGVHWLCVQDRFLGRGGMEFGYRLRVIDTAGIKPDFRVTMKSEIIGVERGKTVNVKCECIRTGSFGGPVELRVVDLPPGITAKPVVIGPKDKAADLKIEATPNATLNGRIIRIEATAEIGGVKLAKPVVVIDAMNHKEESSTALLVVSVKTPFVLKSDYLFAQAPRGSVFRKRFTIERNGFIGPVEVRLADRQARHLQGVTGPTLTIPADATQFDYPISMPPWMEIGRTCRVCVMGIGKIRDIDGTEHQVSFSSVEQNMQMIVVMEPGRLGIELERTSLLVPPEGASLKLRVARGAGLSGPVQVELVRETDSPFQVDRVTIPGDQSNATLQFRRDGKSTEPGTRNVTIRAKLLDRNDPIVAEATLDLVVK